MSFINSKPDTVVPGNVSGAIALGSHQNQPPDFDVIVSSFHGFAVSGTAEMPPSTPEQGSLYALHMGGIPLSMVVPVQPYNQRLAKPKDPENPNKGMGKVPAFFQNRGWHTLPDWQKGDVGRDVLVASEAAGCNGGAILGAPYPLRNPDDKGDIYFWDVDLEDGPNALKWRDAIVRGFGRMAGGQPLMVRSTVPHRAGLLIALPAFSSRGFKKVFHLQHDGVGIGKLEVLAVGQQAVLSGTHPSGRRITWTHDLMPGWRFPAPPMRLGVPRFATYGDFLDVVTALLCEMESYGFTFSETGSGGNHMRVPVAQNAASSGSALVRLLNRMENPPNLDRDVYVEVGIAVGGAREGLIAVNGMLGDTENDEIGEAFINWALKWAPPKGSSATSREAEEKKWNDDFGRPREGKGSGWRRLKELAFHHCNVPDDFLRDLANEEAANEFPAHVAPLKPGETVEQVMDRLHPTSIGGMIRKFNEKYFVVSDAGKVMVWEEKHDPFLKRHYHIRYDFKAFLNLHLKTTVEVHNKKTGQAEREPAAPMWLSHPEGRIYRDGAVFDPSGKDHGPTVLHLWKGYAVKPRPGSWSKLADHIINIICSSDETNASYLLDWIANMFQNPARPGEVAVVMRGIEGCGKGILGEAIIRSMGQHGMSINDAEQTVGKFNLHLRDLIFLFPDEAFFAGNKQHADKLKYLITSPSLQIEGKGANIVTVPNFLHIMMASNHEWVVPAGMESRRYFVLDVSDAKVGDKEYFDAIVAELENGGYEAFVHDMLNRDISKFNPRRAPVTDALIRQRLQSLDTVNAWWLDVLYKGYVFESKMGLETYFRQWRDLVSRDLLYSSYQTYAKSRNERHPMSREALGTFINKFIDKDNQKGNRPTWVVVGEHMSNGHDVPKELPEPDADGKVPADHRYTTANRTIPDLVYKKRDWGYRLGNLAVARKAFTDKTGLKVSWPEDDDEPANLSTSDAGASALTLKLKE